jgi:hypothetical protein
MKRFLDPKNDLTFKRLFGTEKNKGILLAFLKDIFEGVHPKIEDVSFQRLNQCPEIRALAEGVVGLSCRDSEGNRSSLKCNAMAIGPLYTELVSIVAALM